MRTALQTSAKARPEPDNPKCDGRAQFCHAMEPRLQGGMYSKGINAGHMMNFKTGEDLDPLVVYKTSAGDKGLVLNYCPWCGARQNRRYIGPKKRVPK